MRGQKQEANCAHSKSVSPVKEIVYRRPGFCVNAIMPTEDNSTNMRRFFFQRTRQHSALQEYYREQAMNSEVCK
uniref:Uncharacterized protein n=1 Tax=Acrobeloides nanus TaxID=290746 RepID=A0A914EIP0_9BILA